MNKLLSSLLLAASTTSLVAADYYLQADMPAGTNWGTKTSWFDAPTGGNVMGDTITFGGNHFYLNGFDLRTGSTATGESSFNGASLNFTASTERLQVMAGTANINYDLNVSGGGDIMVHTTRAAVTLNVFGTLTANGVFSFRGTVAQNYLTLVVATLAGSGDLIFGNKAVDGTDLGSWSISVADASGFSGRLLPNDGTLTIASASFPNATLFVDPANGALVDLAVDASFYTIDGVGLPSIAAGNYSAADLNSILGAAVFTGSGSLTIAQGYVGGLKWQGYDVQEIDGFKYADTGDFMGVLEVSQAPWIYSFSLLSWVYIPNNSLGAGGGWMFAVR